MWITSGGVHSPVATGPDLTRWSVNSHKRRIPENAFAESFPVVAVTFAALGRRPRPTGCDGLKRRSASLHWSHHLRNPPEERGFAGLRHADDRVWCLFTFFLDAPVQPSPAWPAGYLEQISGLATPSKLPVGPSNLLAEINNFGR